MLRAALVAVLLIGAMLVAPAARAHEGHHHHAVAPADAAPVAQAAAAVALVWVSAADDAGCCAPCRAACCAGAACAMAGCGGTSLAATEIPEIAAAHAVGLAVRASPPQGAIGGSPPEHPPKRRI